MNHLPIFLLKSQDIKEMTSASTLVNEIESLRKQAKRVASKAERSGDYRTTLQGVRELTRITELFAKLCGELNEPSVNVTINSQWIEICSKILSALDGFPEAKIELSKVSKRCY